VLRIAIGRELVARDQVLSEQVDVLQLALLDRDALERVLEVALDVTCAIGVGGAHHGRTPVPRALTVALLHHFADQVTVGVERERAVTLAPIAVRFEQRKANEFTAGLEAEQSEVALKRGVEFSDGSEFVGGIED